MTSGRFSKRSKEVDLKSDRQDSSSKSSNKDTDTGNHEEQEEVKHRTQTNEAEILL